MKKRKKRAVVESSVSTDDTEGFMTSDLLSEEFAPAEDVPEEPAVEEDSEPPPKRASGRPDVEAADEADEDIPEIVREIAKKYGKGTITLASETEACEDERTLTGTFNIDYPLGGGFPDGRIMLAYGDPSSGKTLLALLIAAAFGQSCRKCRKKIKKCDCPSGPTRRRVAWLDAENAWEKRQPERLGVPLKRVYLIKPDTSENAMDAATAIVESGDFDLLVVDSLAHLVPADEVEQSMEKWQQGLMARLINKWLRKLVSALSRSRKKYGFTPSVILINHVRMKIGVMFGDPTVLPGGKGQGFASSIDIRFSSAKYHWTDLEGKEVAKQNAPIGRKPSWVDISFETTKNKTFVNKLGGSFTMFLQQHGSITAGTVLEIEQLWEYGRTYGLIEQSGRTWICGKLQATSKEKLKDALIADVKAQAVLKGRLLTALLSG